MFTICLLNCALNVVCDSLMGSCNSDFCNWASYMCRPRAVRDSNSNFASNFARSALRQVIPASGSWFASADSDLSFIVLSSYSLYIWIQSVWRRRSFSMGGIVGVVVFQIAWDTTFARRALRRVIPVSGSWFATAATTGAAAVADSDLSFIVLFVWVALLFSYGLYSSGFLVVATAAGTTSVGAQGVSS